MYEPPDKKPLVVRETARAPYGTGREGNQQWVTAAEFKTHCLRLIDDVMQSRGEVVVTRYGKPVAKLIPFSEPTVSLFGHMSGSVAEYGDLVSPVDEVWDADA